MNSHKHNPSMLYIHHDGNLVATIDASGLRYAETWLENPASFPLSHSLPLKNPHPETNPVYPRELAWQWLVNLLPEGEARRRITARLKISTDNDLELMRALGRDCAGAITIGDQARPTEIAATQTAQWVSYRALDQKTLVKMTKSPGVVASLIGDEVRLSLAGAQDKIPVRREENGTILLPLHGAPSTHLLKCPNRDFANLVDNELLCLELARTIGLPVAEAEAILIDDRPLLLIKRFDREAPLVPDEPRPKTPQSEDVVYCPNLHRIHQEDFAQALAHPSYEKYESEGGPCFADCMHLVRTTARKPTAEIGPLLRWLIFCLVVGNRDNHAKNLARVRSGNYWSLAPFYDLVCTTAYSRLTTKLAMRIGGIDDPNLLTRDAWTAEAKKIKVGARLLIGIVEEICDSVEDALPSVIEKISEQLNRSNQLVPFRKAIRKGAKLARRSIR